MKSVGRYEIGERIGQGAMANVYRAYDPGIDRVLAVKVLKAEYRQKRQYAARFLREAKAAGALSHPNIVTIFDVGEADGYPYIAMELLEGEPLDRAIQPGRPAAADRVVDIGLQLAEALSYAHGLGVIHRDIKPSNIMLAPDGRSVKILDFGIARMSEAEGLQTQVGQVIGTPRYMSPEQAFGRTVDGRSDLFSVGVVLYELLTGERAFAGESPASLALQIIQHSPRAIGELRPDCPRGLRFIIQKLMAKQPERRFAAGERLAEALRREQAFFAAQAGEAASRRRLPLQVRLALAMGVMTALVLGLSTEAVLTAQYGAMRKMALTSGAAITSFVASNAAVRAADNATLPAAERDWLPVQAFIATAARDPSVRQMAVADSDGIIRAASNPALIGARFALLGGGPVIERTVHLRVSALPSVGGAPGFRFVRPIVYAGTRFGDVDVELSEAELASAAHLSQGLLAALALVTLGVVVVSSYAAARQLARPIRRLRTALSDAAAGNLDFRISHVRKDEFGELFDAFNRFTGAVQIRLEGGEVPDEPVPNAPGRLAPDGPSDVVPPPFATPRSAEEETASSGLATQILDPPGAAGSPSGDGADAHAPSETPPAALWRSRWARSQGRPSKASAA
ncbi:MAG: protein kinase domain-containing protein [Caulobacteraceae bacterium]